MSAPSSRGPLFQPLSIREHVLPNRIVNTAHQTNLAEGGLVGERQIAYYEARAAGGAGMIVAGGWAAWQRTWSTPLANLAVHPEALAGHRELAQAVHRHGTLLVGQLHDSGRQGSSAWQRLPLLAPSAIPDPVVREIPKVLEDDEIAEMIGHHALAAKALCDAGWDGVEIFAAQGYALAQFLSPQTNRRDDRHGGTTVVERMGVVLEVLAAVRASIGPGPLVGVRINADDLVAGGLHLDDAKQVAIRLQQTDQVDYLSVSGGSNERYPGWIPEMGRPVGTFIGLAGQIRAVTSLPVVVTSRIASREIAERAIQDGEADLVGMTRALIADPDLPRKLAAGADRDVRPCLACNQGCLGSLLSGGPLSCTVNPHVGRESTPVAMPQTRRRVLVVGGGPAGLQAAVSLAERGHEVTLHEREEHLGGQLVLAGRTRSRSEIGSIIPWLHHRAELLGVAIVLGSDVSAWDVDRDAAEVIVLATGSTPLTDGFTSALPHVRHIPGHDLPHVGTVWDALAPELDLPRRAVVLDDDPHGQATTAAEYLAERGVDVMLVTRSLTTGQWAGPANAEPLHRRLSAAGVTMVTSTWARAIGEHHVDLHSIYTDDVTRVDGIDRVYLATGNEAETTVYDALVEAGETRRIRRIGDCLAPRRLDQAIWDGSTVRVDD